MKTVTRQEKLTVEHKTFLGLKGKDMEEMKKQEFDMALQVMITTFFAFSQVLGRSPTATR
jgi:hypothetical protein